MRIPVDEPYRITTQFGVQDSYAKFGYHSGIDYAVPTGRAVYAPVGGNIVYARNHSTGGNMVILYDGTYFHRFMHNSAFRVTEGQTVTHGQLIALAGTTGLSTGPHVHWDICKQQAPSSFNDFINPNHWLSGGSMSTPTLLPYQRQVAEAGVNHRDEPNTSARIRKEWGPGEILDFKGFVKGQAVSGNDIWFVGRHTGGYCWSGSFKDMGTHDLPDLTAPAPTPTPQPAPAPPVIQYSTKPTSVGAWGVDVSAFQKSLDFNLLKQQGIEYAILRAGHVGASYGGNVNKTDPTLETFQKNARNAGMSVGYYWYCFYDEDPETEAARFVQSIGQSVNEPMFADIEEVHGANRVWVDKFCDTVEALAGRPCHIYTYTNFLNTQPWLRECIKGERKLWIAHYDIPAGAVVSQPAAIMHQYTSKGVLKGVGSQYIDLNLFYGTAEDFRRLGVPIAKPHVPLDPVVPADDPLPTDKPPAPLPTPDNNPVRPKVKAAGIAGIVLTVTLAVFNVLWPGNTPTEVEVAPFVTAVTTMVTFGAAYLKRDGLSPDEG